MSSRAPDHLPGLRQACPTDDLGHRGQPTTVPLQTLGPRLPGLTLCSSWGGTEAWGQEACSECCRPGSQKRETLSDGPSKHQAPLLREERPFLPSISSETHSRAGTGAGQGARTLLGVPRAKSVAVGPSSPSLPPKSITKGKSSGSSKTVSLHLFPDLREAAGALNGKLARSFRALLRESAVQDEASLQPRPALAGLPRPHPLPTPHPRATTVTHQRNTHPHLQRCF